MLGKHWDPTAAGEGTTNLAYLLRAHASCHIALVLEHEQTRPHQPLPLSSASTLSSWICVKVFTSCRRSPSSSCRQSSIRSRSVPSTTHMSVSVFSKWFFQYVRSVFCPPTSPVSRVSFAVRTSHLTLASLTDVQLVPVYLSCQLHILTRDAQATSPFIVDCFDDEAESG